MLKLFNKIRKTGIVTEKVDMPSGLSDKDSDSLQALGVQVKTKIDKHFSGSFAIRAVDAGSCNACELEIQALGNPIYDIERFGVHFVASPRHADALLVTGPVSCHMAEALLSVWQAVPEPKFLIAMGDCAVDGGEFAGSYAVMDGVSDLLSPDVLISGCPPTPEIILKAVLALLQNNKA